MSACPVNYPSVQDAIPCFTEIVKLLRAGTIVEDVDHALKHAWVIQGAALGAILGDPDVPPLIGDTDYSTDEGKAAILESCVTVPDTKSAFPIPWSLVLKIVSELISRLLEKKTG